MKFVFFHCSLHALKTTLPIDPTFKPLVNENILSLSHFSEFSALLNGYHNIRCTTFLPLSFVSHWSLRWLEKRSGRLVSYKFRLNFIGPFMTRSFRHLNLCHCKCIFTLLWGLFVLFPLNVSSMSEVTHRENSLVIAAGSNTE